MVEKLDKKPKIALIIDKEGWAFYNAAKQIKKYLNEFYEIDIISMEIFGDNVVKLFLLGSEYDLMFFMWRGIISWVYSEYSRHYINELGFEFDEFLEQYIKNKNILTGIYDHLFIKNESERTNFILDNIKSYIVCSKKLEEIYNNYPSSKKPSMIISDGVDLELFKMNNISKYNNIENRTIKLGWTGNSKFSDDEDDDLKGLKKIILPAIKELKDEGYDIVLKIADRNIKMIPHNEMPNYYNDIDIYICASRTEGHPDPILEAMACGDAIISTDVGIVNEVLGEKQKNFIIERSKEELKKKIIYLYNNKYKIKELSEENLQQIKNWSWKNKANLYKKFFDKNILEKGK